PVAVADTEGDRDAHGDADREGDAHADSDGDGKPGRADTDADADAHPDPGADRNAVAYRVADADPYPDAVADADSYPDAVADADSHADADAGTDPDAYADAGTDPEPHTDAVADADRPRRYDELHDADRRAAVERALDHVHRHGERLDVHDGRVLGGQHLSRRGLLCRDAEPDPDRDAGRNPDADAGPDGHPDSRTADDDDALLRNVCMESVQRYGAHRRRKLLRQGRVGMLRAPPPAAGGCDRASLRDAPAPGACCSFGQCDRRRLPAPSDAGAGRVDPRRRPVDLAHDHQPDAHQRQRQLRVHDQRAERDRHHHDHRKPDLHRHDARAVRRRAPSGDPSRSERRESSPPASQVMR